MKILIAPDSFKETMSSAEAAAIIAGAFRHSLPSAEIVVFPMADGGEGTADAVIRATGAEKCFVRVTGPLDECAEACYGLLPDGRTAVMDMASASGIELVPRDRLDPLRATTFGTGELMRSALHSGVRELILGIGGSSTVDGGAGMAQALGYRLLTAAGDECGRGGGELGSIVAIDPSGVDPALSDCRIRVACDVTNPLLGETGAAAVFGPQKGATPAMVQRLEAGLAHLAELWKDAAMVASVEDPGDGAAGGLGAGLRAFCGAEVLPGATLVAEITGFDREIRKADILVTGEGRTDEQAAHGKLCPVLAAKAKAAGAKTILISGTVAEGAAPMLHGFDEVYSSISESDDRYEAIRNARRNLETVAKAAAHELARSLQGE